MTTKYGYALTFITATLIAIVLGFPFTGAAISWASGEQQPFSTSVILITGPLYFAALLLGAWRWMADKKRGKKVVQTTALMFLLFTALGALDDGVDSQRRTMTVVIPAVCALLIVAGFWASAEMERQRFMQIPPEDRPEH
jgi:hypothetical protein